MTNPNRSDSAAQPAPTPNPLAKRLTGLQLVQKAKQFALRLNANARWMKQFLHGSH